MYRVNLNENIFLGQPEKKDTKVVPFANQILEAPYVEQLCSLVKSAINAHNIQANDWNMTLEEIRESIR